MGVLRGFGLVIVSVLLFVTLVLAGIFATLNYSLTYENVQPKIYSIADNVISQQIGSQKLFDELSPYLDTYCQNNTEIVQKFDNYTFVFPCEVVAQGYNSTLNYTVNYLVKDFYYKDYNCSFIKCFEETDVPLFLVSNYAKDYWKSLFNKTILIGLILIGLVILLVEKKSNSLILTGSFFTASSLVISQLKNIGTKIAKLIISPISTALSSDSSKEIVSQVVNMFFSESTKVFLWMFIAGLILIVAGIILKLTGIGFKIKSWIDKRKSKDKIEELEKNQKEIKEKIGMKKQDNKK